MTTRRRTLALSAAALAAVAALAGCSVKSSSTAGTSSSATSQATPAAQFGTAAPGVTATTIKIGVIYPDFTSILQYGIHIDQGNFVNAYTAQINKINAAGGIAGRKIVPVFAKYSLVNSAAATQTCVQLTDDDKVFAVLGLFESDTQALCYAQTHSTAVIGSAISNADFALEKAPWFAYGDHAADDASLAIDALYGSGQLAGKKVAVIALQQDASSMNNSAIPELKAKGITPVSTAVMTASTSDATALGSQVSVAVQKFQSAGANVVIIVGGLATEFPPIVAKTSYRPQLMFTSASDADSGSSSSRVSTAVYAKALAADLATDFSDPAEQACIQTMETAYPSLQGKLVNPTTVASGKPTLESSVEDACEGLAVLSDIGNKAGKSLNYSTFQQAGLTLGKVHIPGYSEDANYSPTTPYGQLAYGLFHYDAATSEFVQS